jgi:hypothetical protein
MPPMTPTRNFARRLRDALVADLGSVGIGAQVKVSKVAGTRLHRVTVVSRDFGPLRPSERQDLVWRIVRKHFTQDEDLLISLILTLTPRDIGGS